MATFVIYPKKGKSFKTDIRRFDLGKSEFILYDDYDKPSKAGYIAFDKVSAIVREDAMGYQDQSKLRYQARNYFEVRLKDREETILICAEKVDFTDPPSVRFYGRNWSSNEDMLLPDIYIVLDDVVAILLSNAPESV